MALVAKDNGATISLFVLWYLVASVEYWKELAHDDDAENGGYQPTNIRDKHERNHETRSCATRFVPSDQLGPNLTNRARVTETCVATQRAFVEATAKPVTVSAHQSLRVVRED